VRCLTVEQRIAISTALAVLNCAVFFVLDQKASFERFTISQGRAGWRRVRQGAALLW
jgi:hypothetical protein